MALTIGIIALVVAALSAWVSWLQVRHARAANALPIVVGLLSEFRETREDRYFIVTRLAEYDATEGVWGLPPDVRERVLRVLHYCDHLGLLVERGYADEDAIAGFIGGAIIHLWSCVAPLVHAERVIREKERGQLDSQYQNYFEDLASRMKRKDPLVIRQRLETFTP